MAKFGKQGEKAFKDKVTDYDSDKNKWNASKLPPKE